MPSANVWRAAFLCGALGALTLACNCAPTDTGAGGSPASSSTTSSTTSTSTSTTSTTSSGQGGAGPCNPVPAPSVVPAGWTHYQGWTCSCRLYYPPTPDLMPPPIAWEPCPPVVSGVDCRMMTVDWTTEVGATASDAFMSKDALGARILEFRRVAYAPETHWYEIVAEPDGLVRQALLVAPGPQYGCYTTFDGVKDGFNIHGVEGYSYSGGGEPPVDRGAIGGPIDEPAPSLVAHYTDGLARSFAGSSKWVAQMDITFKLLVAPWESTEWTPIHSPATDPEGISAGEFEWSGDAFFFGTTTATRSGINVWDPVNGTRPFVRWPGDATKGAADLGTDGVDLVWAYGEGKAPGASVYPLRSIMTAPFTADPATVAATARRLRSNPDDNLGGSKFVVGCGYAAHDGGEHNVLVVRLADGWSWFVPKPPFIEGLLAKPVGITCDDVFIKGTLAGQDRVVRIRLDSLGPGMPPD